MDSVAKTFHYIPLHVNPFTDAEEGVERSQSTWFCDLKFLSSTACPTSVFAIGLEDPSTHRHVFCTSLTVSVKEMLHADEVERMLQRPYATMRRQKNASIGRFLHGLSLTVSADKRLEAFMLADDNDSPSDDSVLTLVMHVELNPVINTIALEAGVISENEEIERINLSLSFSCISRPAHIASLALMMAAHDRLGKESAIGRVLGVDLLRLVCCMYQLRLYECRSCVWGE